MPLKKASGKVETLEVEGSIIHAVKPNKAAWDDYTDDLFDRDEKGNLKPRSGKAIEAIYRRCVRKLENVVLGVDAEGKDQMGSITNEDEIVKFLKGLESAEAGRKIDSWLLGLGELTGDEAKN